MNLIAHHKKNNDLGECNEFSLKGKMVEKKSQVPIHVGDKMAGCVRWFLKSWQNLNRKQQFQGVCCTTVVVVVVELSRDLCLYIRFVAFSAGRAIR